MPIRFSQWLVLPGISPACRNWLHVLPTTISSGRSPFQAPRRPWLRRCRSQRRSRSIGRNFCGDNGRSAGIYVGSGVARATRYQPVPDVGSLPLDHFRRPKTCIKPRLLSAHKGVYRHFYRHEASAFASAEDGPDLTVGLRQRIYSHRSRRQRTAFYVSSTS